MRPKFSLALLHPRYGLSWCGLAALAVLVTVLPWSWQMALGGHLGRLSQRFARRRVGIARRNLELALPELTAVERDALLTENFANVGRALFELGMAWFWPDWRMRQLLTIEGLEHRQAAVAQGLGVISLSAHFLTIEVNARSCGLVGAGMGVYRPNNNPVLEYAQYHGRCRSNKYLIDRKDVRGMVKALRTGEAIWYAPDHDYGRKAAVFVPFLGVPAAATVTGTSTLARVKNTVVLPCYSLRTATGYTLRIEPPLENYPTGDLVADAARIYALLGAWIVAHPAQYMWMHRRFKTRPNAGDPSLYPAL